MNNLLIEAASNWEKSLATAWPADPEDSQGAWVIGTIDEDGNKYPVITVEADQYDAPGESEKIARAIIALWAKAFTQPLSAEIQSPEPVAPAPGRSIQWTIIPAGTPTAESVIWNALIECRSAIRTDFKVVSKQSALNAIDEAIAFRGAAYEKREALLEDQRVLFEANLKGRSLERYATGNYVDPFVAGAWLGWQLRIQPTG